MSALRDHKHPTTFECVDADPEYINGLSGDSNEALIYFIRPTCSVGLNCPPYNGGQEITCVVCTK